VLFFGAAAVAFVATLLTLLQANAVHGLLYFIVSLLAVALVFFTLGAPLVAALEVIIYAGAIMVLFLFVLMTVNRGEEDVERERRWLGSGRAWTGAGALAAVLLVELVLVLAIEGGEAPAPAEVGPVEAGAALFGPYILGVEIASMLLLAGLIGAYHLGRRG